MVCTDLLLVQAPDSNVETRFKLLLRSASSSAPNADIPRTVLPPGKTVEDVYSDFYKYMFDHTRKYIRETLATGSLLWDSLEGDIEFILTHPNGWEGQQQSLMRQAAVQGGLVADSEEGKGRVSFVTEGEASLHFCLSKGLVVDGMKVGVQPKSRDRELTCE